MKAIITGSGTSHGIPVISCDCKVCTSTDPRDFRNRASLFICEPVNLVVDTGPEFRLQAIKYKIKSLDAVFITHSHADHLHGIDDIRIYSHTKSFGANGTTAPETEGNGLPFYANHWTIEDIKKRFDYIFKTVHQGGGKPKILPIDADEYSEKQPIIIEKNEKKLKAIPVNLMHGTIKDAGWIFIEETKEKKKSFLYLTDCNFISDNSFELINRITPEPDVLVIDGLRIKEHSTHFSFEQALQAADRIGAKRTYLTHITHNSSHVEIIDFINSHLCNYPKLKEIVKNGGIVEPAYDGLEICI